MLEANGARRRALTYFQRSGVAITAEEDTMELVNTGRYTKKMVLPLGQCLQHRHLPFGTDRVAAI